MVQRKTNRGQVIDMDALIAQQGDRPAMGNAGTDAHGNVLGPNGEIETNSEKFFIFGNKGVYDNNNQTLLINGDVEFTNKNSIKFETSVAEFDFRKQILTGNESVIGRKNDTIIKSEGFKIINKENKVIFFGKSYLTLNK